MKWLAALLALALLPTLLAACGGSDGASTGDERTVRFEADPNGDLSFTSDEVEARAGRVTIDFNNPQGTRHDVNIANASGTVVAETQLIGDESTSLSTELAPGTYTFYCNVPGHRKAGMEGTLVVTG